LPSVSRKNQPTIVSGSEVNRPPHLSSREEPGFIDPHDFYPSYVLQCGAIHQLLKSVESCKPLLLQNFNPRRRGSHHKDVFPGKSCNSPYRFLHHGGLTRSRGTTD